MLTLLNIFIGVVWLAAIYLFSGEQVRFALRILYNIGVAIRNKRSLPPAVACANPEQWPEPSDILPLPADAKSDKIIWAFWHSGEETLPGFCQLAIQSLRFHHPDWNIIVLSDANYRSYVSPSDLPSTFASLKVQYRSDLIRLAVLRRYGGLYLDASYTVYRAFDNIWNTAKSNNDLYITSLVSLQETGPVRFPNNCFILAPQPQNPVLVAWQRRCIEYLENPALTTADASNHPLLQRVAHHFSDPALGALSLLTAYFGVIWNLADVLYYEPSVREYVQDHVWILPSFRWTFDHVMIKCPTMGDKDILHGESFHEGLSSWLVRIPNALRVMFVREVEVVERMLDLVVAVKTSSDFYPDFHKPVEYHINRPSSLGIFHRASIDESREIRQADTVGAKRVVPLVRCVEDVGE